VPRVLILTPDYPPALGGIQTLVHRVVRGFTTLEAHVVTVDHPRAAAFDAAQAHQVTRVAAPRRVRRARTVALNRRALDVAAKYQPDLILSAHIVTSPAAALLGRLRGVPVVQYVYAKEMGAKPLLSRFAIRSADRVIAISRYAAELAREHGGSFTKTELITPGVDLPPGPVVRSPAERPTMLTVSRLEDRYKGHDILIRALPLLRAAVPDIEWVVLGEGPLRAGLERMATATGVGDAVRFLGAVDDAERDHWLRSAHLFAMPSRLPAGGFAGEGFGIVYLEANAHGMPVLAGNVAGALDAVVDGETGVLVDPADHIAVAGGAARILTDPGWAAALGRQGAERAQRFAWPAISEQVERLLLQVAGKPVRHG
jgi:phosphatidylinositol alpha-1,6-mannosyltransferase